MEIPESRMFYYRPYDLSVTPEKAASLDNTVSSFLERKSSRFTPSEVPGGMMSPTAVPHDQVLLPGGWETTRYTFIIKILYKINSIASVTYYVTGYTDETSPSMMGTMDPETTLYVNNVLEVNEHNYLSGSNTILHDHTTVMNSDTNHHKVVRLQDAVEADNVSSFLNGQEQYIGEDSYINMDHRYTMDVSGRNMRAEEQVGQGFIGNAVSYWVEQVISNMTLEHMDTYMEGMGDEIPMPSEFKQEPTTFIPAIKILKKTNIEVMANAIKYRDLMLMDETILSRTMVTPYDSNTSGIYVPAYDCERWEVVTEEARIASIIATQVPPLMLALGVISCGIIFTNMDDPTMTPKFTILTPIVFGGLDTNRHAVILQRRIQNEIIPTITGNNKYPVSFRGHISLVGNSTVEVTVGNPNNQPTPFNVPAFGTGVVSPNIMPDMNSYSNFMAGFGELKNLVTDSANSVLNETKPQPIYTPLKQVI